MSKAKLLLVCLGVATVATVLWAVLGHYAIGWSLQDSLLQGVVFWPFFVGFLGIAYFVQRVFDATEQ